MRRILILFIAVMTVSGCLKKEVLDEDLEGVNFQETEFYTSGEFHAEFALTVEEIEVEIIENDQGETRCKPSITFRLEKDFAARIEKHWAEDIRISIDPGFQRNKQRYKLSPGYTAPFVLHHHAITCGSSVHLSYQLDLIAPNTGRVSAYAKTSEDIMITP